jgi:hypothetical protein
MSTDRIHVYNIDHNDGHCTMLITELKGHVDWIRAIVFECDRFDGNLISFDKLCFYYFAVDTSTNNQSSFIRLASASQDKHARVWKLSPMSSSDDIDNVKRTNASKNDERVTFQIGLYMCVCV